MLQFCLSRGSGTTNTRTLYPYMHGEGLPGQRDGAVTAFGPLLRRLRMAAGLSQEALAERARISTEAVGALERGTRQAPQRQTLALLIEALGVDGSEREGLERAAVRPSSPRRRRSESSLVGVVSALRLPTPLTSFVGREDDLAGLIVALSEARLVSLLGPGGVGKSRLALEAARRCGEQFNEGVSLIELAPVASGASVLPAFASTLGIADEGQVDLLDRVVALCGDGRRLLVVDNCEHVLDDVAAVVYPLLASCPNVCVIATSREPLRIDGERIVRLGPLPADAALQLFIDRSKAVAPYVHFHSDALRVAGSICRRVDGIPLAIELAASRTDVFDLTTISKRLNERFKLLTGRSRTMHPHQRTLRTLVDWSYDLLDPEEARVFRRLGIFAGGARFDDAEEVLSFDGVVADSTADLLARLHDKSLIDVDRADPPRFSILQTMLDYARERLDDASERRRLETQYARHYLEVAIAAGPALRSAAQGEAIERLSAEIDNIRASLVLSHESSELRECGLIALGHLAQYWMRTGGLTDGLTHIELLTADVREPSIGVAWACVGGAFLEYNRARFSEGRAYAARAYEAATACEDEWLTIYSSNAVHAARSALGERPRAAVAANFERAKRLGDPWLIAGAAFQAGHAALQSGDRHDAALHFTESLRRARAIGDEFIVMTSALYLARALTTSEPVRAVQLIREATECLTPGATIARARCMEALAAVARVLGYPQDARRLEDVAERLCLPTGIASLDDASEAMLSFVDLIPVSGSG